MPPVTGSLQGRSWVVVQGLLGYTDVGAKPLFSTLLAPTVSGAFGGNVLPPYNFTLTNPNAAGTIYYTVDGTDPRPIGGGAPSGALTGASPISVGLSNSAVVRARVYDSATTKWSPVVEPQYITGVPATASNLVISEIHYHPASVNGLEEFIELLNVGPNNIDFTNVRFTLGVQFTFPLGYLLTPGSRILIVRDMAAFTAAYPSVPAGQIAGVFANASSLSNGGERLQLLNATNAVIHDFTYGTSAPWPETPDGLGPSLVLKRPETNPSDTNLDNGGNWRASVANGGVPGLADALTYSAWAAANGVSDALGTADDDGDGLANLCEFAVGLDPKTPSLSPAFAGSQNYLVNGIAGDYLTLTFTRPMGRDDITYSVEAGSDLTAAWVTAIPVGTPVNNGNATETLTYRHPTPQAGQPQQYMRLRITRLP